MEQDKNLTQGEDKNQAAQVEMEDPVENIGAKLVRQAAAKTNDLAGNGTTISVEPIDAEEPDR